MDGKLEVDQRPMGISLRAYLTINCHLFNYAVRSGTIKKQARLKDDWKSPANGKVTLHGNMETIQKLASSNRMQVSRGITWWQTWQSSHLRLEE